jgi:hypothetical protein
MNTNWIWESKLPNRFGINRDELRELRNKLLTEGEHWRVEKTRVLISPLGLTLLTNALSMDCDVQAAAGVTTAGQVHTEGGSEKKAPEKANAERLVALCVWRAPMPNLRIIEAYFPEKKPAGQSDVLRVRVKDGRLYARYDNTGKPMMICCRHIQADLYEHAGGVPKRKGRA